MLKQPKAQTQRNFNPVEIPCVSPPVPGASFALDALAPSGAYHAVLTYDELRATRSLNELRVMYRIRGVECDDPSALVQQVAKDWRIASELTFGKLQEEHRPAQFGHIDLIVEGSRYTIFGALPRLELANLHPKAPELLDKAVANCTGIVVTHDLAPDFTGAIQLPDHLARGVLWHGIRAWLADHRTMASILRRSFSSPAPAGKTPPTMPLETLSVSSDIHRTLPRHIEIMLREEKRSTYTRSQARAAYTAVFLKNWNPSPHRCSQDKTLLCLESQARSIEYFLHSPPRREPALVERAIRDAHSCNEDPERFRQQCRRRERRSTIISELLYGAEAGVLASSLFFLQ